MFAINSMIPSNSGSNRQKVHGQLRRKKIPWSAAEEELLKKGVQRFSSGDRKIPWTKIFEFGGEVFVNRKPVDLKEKWGRICKKFKKVEVDGAASLPFLNEDAVQLDEEEDLDLFSGFSKTWSGNEEEIDEDDEKLLEAFLLKNARPHTLADLAADKLKMDDSIIELYRGVGKHLNEYTAGKIPMAFKQIPHLRSWEEVLYLIEPDKWSPNAMFQATRLFSSNCGVKKAELFYKLVLLPRIREDISTNKKLHFALSEAFKKSLCKPGAFNRGILFPLCESRTCNLREAVIIGSILQKVSIPPLYSSVALLKLAEMEYCGTTSYFIQLLMEKKHALSYHVLDAMVEHFMAFLDDERVMPMIWHQSLLAFVQRYKNELVKEDKLDLNALVERQKHRLVRIVTPEICRELKDSRNRGEKEDDLLSTSSSAYVINKTIEKEKCQ